MGVRWAKLEGMQALWVAPAVPACHCPPFIGRGVTAGFGPSKQKPRSLRIETLGSPKRRSMKPLEWAACATSNSNRSLLHGVISKHCSRVTSDLLSWQCAGRIEQSHRSRERPASDNLGATGEALGPGGFPHENLNTHLPATATAYVRIHTEQFARVTGEPIKTIA